MGFQEHSCSTEKQPPLLLSAAGQASPQPAGGEGGLHWSGARLEDILGLEMLPPPPRGSPSLFRLIHHRGIFFFFFSDWI